MQNNQAQQSNRTQEILSLDPQNVIPYLKSLGLIYNDYYSIIFEIVIIYQECHQQNEEFRRVIQEAKNKLQKQEIQQLSEPPDLDPPKIQDIFLKLYQIGNINQAQDDLRQCLREKNYHLIQTILNLGYTNEQLIKSSTSDDKNELQNQWKTTLDEFKGVQTQFKKIIIVQGDDEKTFNNQFFQKKQDELSTLFKLSEEIHNSVKNLISKLKLKLQGTLDGEEKTTLNQFLLILNQNELIIKKSTNLLNQVILLQNHIWQQINKPSIKQDFKIFQSFLFSEFKDLTTDVIAFAMYCLLGNYNKKNNEMFSEIRLFISQVNSNNNTQIGSIIQQSQKYLNWFMQTCLNKGQLDYCKSDIFYSCQKALRRLDNCFLKINQVIKTTQI